MPYNNIWKKGLVVGIIIPFISVSVLTNVSSKDVSVSDGMLEYNNEIESVDNNTEIITKIDGVSYEVEIHSKKGFFRNVTFYGGGSTLEIFGWKYHFPIYFHERVTTIHANSFIGIIYELPWWEYSIKGIALGNIEWRK
jgi:hypothetical protein